MNDARKLELVQEALHDLQAGKLDIHTTLIVIGMIVSPPEVTQEALDWAKKVLHES